MSEGGWGVVLLVVGAAIWFWLGDPARDMRRLFNQQTYEDKLEALQSHVQAGKIGDGSDVWLVKLNAFGQPAPSLLRCICSATLQISTAASLPTEAF